MATTGYMFLSRNLQSHDEDLAWMKDFGCESIIEESGSQEKLRPEWRSMLAGLRKGDTVVVSRLGNALRGNWGDSWAWTIPVTQEFHNTVWYSFALGFVAFIFEILIAIPLGITAAKKQYGFTDYFTTVVAMICISLPTFFLATVLKYVFAVNLGWFELSGMQSRNYLNLFILCFFDDKLVRNSNSQINFFRIIQIVFGAAVVKKFIF